MFKRIGDFFSTIFSHIGKSLPTFLSVVAVITIIDYLTSRQENSYLPILVFATGFMAIILPALCRRFKVFYSIISTGWAILLIQTIYNYMPISTTSVKITLIVFLVAAITDISLGNCSFSDAIFNYILSYIASMLIAASGTTPLAMVLILLVTYFIVITVKFNIFFSLKRESAVIDEIDDADE